MCALIGLLIWAYFPTFLSLANRWLSDPQYSHGYLVPGFALALLWLRRNRLTALSPCYHWQGVLLLALSSGLCLAGTYFYFSYFIALSLLPALAGICVLMGGWQALRGTWVSIAFLVYMIPLPHRLEIALAHPLRRLATVASTYLLQAAGVPSMSEGNVILLKDSRIGIVEACSGLSMLLVFFALSTAVACVTKRPLVDRIVLILSAVPIALIANVSRIVLTGVLHETVGTSIGNLVFHDLSGWLMMPFALLMLGGELVFLSRLYVEVGPFDERLVNRFAVTALTGASPSGKADKRGKRKRKPKDRLGLARS
jgi:exosortase